MKKKNKQKVRFAIFMIGFHLFTWQMLYIAIATAPTLK